MIKLAVQIKKMNDVIYQNNTNTFHLIYYNLKHKIMLLFYIKMQYPLDLLFHFNIGAERIPYMFLHKVFKAIDH
jgi:hypothetical protein